MSVLLVEDNDINALIVLRLLETLGARVRRVADGPAAVSALRANLAGATPGYDVALMDLRMPGLDGIEVTRLYRVEEALKGSARLPIIALTADAFEDTRQACLAAGFQDFLAKPVDLEALGARLAALRAAQRKLSAA